MPSFFVNCVYLCHLTGRFVQFTQYLVSIYLQSQTFNMPNVLLVLHSEAAANRYVVWWPTVCLWQILKKSLPHSRQNVLTFLAFPTDDCHLNDANETHLHSPALPQPHTHPLPPVKVITEPTPHHLDPSPHGVTPTHPPTHPRHQNHSILHSFFFSFFFLVHHRLLSPTPERVEGEGGGLQSNLMNWNHRSA